jgi:hypothetical protein
MSRNLFFGKHSSAAIRDPAVAWGVFPRLCIVDVVIVGQLLTGGDVAQCDDPDPALDLVGFTVWAARMIDERGHAKTVDDRLAAIHAEEVGYFAVGVHPVCLARREARTGVLQDARPAGYRMGCIYPRAVQSRGSNDEAHENCSFAPRSPRVAGSFDGSIPKEEPVRGSGLSSRAVFSWPAAGSCRGLLWLIRTPGAPACPAGGLFRAGKSLL